MSVIFLIKSSSINLLFKHRNLWKIFEIYLRIEKAGATINLSKRYNACTAICVTLSNIVFRGFIFRKQYLITKDKGNIYLLSYQKWNQVLLAVQCIPKTYIREQDSRQKFGLIWYTTMTVLYICKEEVLWHEQLVYIIWEFTFPCTCAYRYITERWDQKLRSTTYTGT